MESENTGIFIPIHSNEKIEQRKQDWSKFFSRIEETSTLYDDDEGISIIEFDSLLSEKSLSDGYTSTRSTLTQRPTKKIHRRKKIHRSNKWGLLCKKYSMRHHNVVNEKENLEQEIVTSNFHEKTTFRKNNDYEEEFKHSENFFHDCPDKLNKESQFEPECTNETKNMTDTFSNYHNAEEIINEQKNTSRNSHERSIINSTNIKRKATETPATNKKKKIKLKPLYFYSDDIKDKQAEYTCNRTLISWEDFMNDDNF